MMKVLVVYSWDDDISQRRYARMKGIASRSGYDFDQCFAVPSPRTPPTPNGVTNMISAAVDQFQPDVLLIHTGAAYHQVPDAFSEAARRIHHKYPGLRLGFEHRPHLDLGNLSVFETSEEMTRIEQTFFGLEL